MNENQAKRSRAALSLAGAFVCFLLLWLLDFPKPYLDDLFYCGGGLNLAQGGGLSNPLIAGQEFPNSFFVYPPLESYVLAGWLKLFGISVASMTAFPIFMYFLIAAATIAILRHHGSPAWVEWLVPFAVCAAFLRTGGLRPEPLAIALVMLSMAMFECGARSKWTVFLAFMLLFLGGSAAPRVAPFCLVPICLIGIKLRHESSVGGIANRAAACLGIAALALSILAFLLMIHFRLGDFLETFRLHSSRAHIGVKAMVDSARMVFVDIIGVLLWPLLALPVVLFMVFLQQPWDRLKSLAIITSLIFLAAAAFGFLGPGSIWFAVFVSLLLAASDSKQLSGWRAPVLKLAIVMALIVGNGRSLVLICGILTGRLDSQQGDQLTAALALHSDSEHRLIVDVDQARYLFGYRIPPGFLAYEYAARHPNTYAFQEIRKSDIYVVSPRTVDQLNERTLLNAPSPPKWKPIGPSRWWLDEHPRWVCIIPAENCKSMRPQP